ncbi:MULTISPECIES: Cu(I)-responsive transcriptional regulator [unclassified Diaphorobacter]|uniref:Cu(I)-responsive transcriptional regulator n=1 Tax=unclassified Diaphorobacter TaxID=2649760 RepID=UPI001C73135E|nr:MULTISPECIES: Cu(I)-responsive transcriptional regulator [unclassified Diaphorobacter]QYY25642.1 Cu(I)-responsive transcriptional regulator [Diaphorobacter sp. MNS-0]
MSTAPRRPAHRVPSDGAGPVVALDWPVAIGTAAERAGVSARMLRHYESLGLLTGVARTDSGYRQYTEADVHTLRFIRRARDLGFSMEEIATLLGLWQDKQRASSQVKRIAQAHIDNLSERIAAMQAMQRSLQALVHCCHGDDRPDCPILDDLAMAGIPNSGAADVAI